uniref:ABC transporter domain-containing protein n=1 Tax=Electrophorus electricus TaxID=8005 RepID=A0A4W4FE15_ELEEL
MDEGLECDRVSVHAEEAALYFQAPGPTVSFYKLRYCVKKRTGIISGKWMEKEVLKDVSGIMKSGMNAIMGPTGSRKTSLLDVLAGRKDPKGLKSGQVLVDNSIMTTRIRLSAAYVVQNDVLMGTLTVKENLTFSANLRLSPADYTSLDKAENVDSVIQELGLKDCADTKIGAEFLQGVSGGERKRCSIGMELITSPSLLFLDEPTTGLDSNTASAIVALLHNLSRKGKTVIFSIHQPRFSIFRQFDHLTLLNKGEVVYAAAADQAISYFEGLGYKCEPFNNPADFFLDITNENLFPQGDAGKSGTGKSETLNSGDIMLSCENPLALRYRQSSQYCQLTEHLQELTQGLSLQAKTGSDQACYATSFCYQLRLVSSRTVKNILKNPQTSYIPHTLPEALQNRTGAFFFLVINMVFGNLSAVELFISDRVLFIHENSSGYYRTSVYFLSKVFADLIPNRILPVFFSAIPYFMMALKPKVEAFFLFLSLAFLVSTSVGSFAMANILIALPFVFMMVFGSFLVNLNSMLSWMSWLKWFSIFRYGFNLREQVFTSNYTIMTGEMYLDQQEIDHSTWGFWQNLVALTGIMCVCLMLAYVQLCRINRWR